jgi:hypothetical protein
MPGKLTDSRPQAGEFAVRQREADFIPKVVSSGAMRPDSAFEI